MTNLIKVQAAVVESEVILNPIAVNICSGDLVNRWLSFAGVSAKSEKTYRGALKQLSLYLQSEQISQPARADLEKWRDSLIESGKSASTILLYLQAAKLFFRFAAQEGLYPNVADHLKSRVKVDHSNFKRDALSIQQAKDLQRAIVGKDLKNLRDRAIVALMLATGIRSIEVVRANFGDLRLKDGENYLYVQGKGRFDKSECVLVPDKVFGYINQYLKARGKVAKNAPLFVSTSRRNQNCRLSTRTIRGLIKEKMRTAGLDAPTLTCHNLRHTAACVMFKQNEKLTDIQLVLRHKNISTTMIYLNAINRMKCRAEITAASVIII